MGDLFLTKPFVTIIYKEHEVTGAFKEYHFWS